MTARGDSVPPHLTDQLFRSAPTATGVTTGNNTNFYGVSIDLGASFR